LNPKKESILFKCDNEGLLWNALNLIIYPMESTIPPLNNPYNQMDMPKQEKKSQGKKIKIWKIFLFLLACVASSQCLGSWDVFVMD
jgi:hypothetical protein